MKIIQMNCHEKSLNFMVGADFIKTFLYTIIFNSRKCLELSPLGFTVKKKRRILAYLEFKSYYKFSEAPFSFHVNL